MRRAAHLQHGLSILEFVAFLAALAGGVVLGSMYLGVDLQKVGVAALQRTQLIDSGDVQPEAQPAPVADNAPDTTTPAPSQSAASEETTTTTAADPIAAPDGASADHPAPTAEPATSAPAESAPAANDQPLTADSSPLARLLKREELIALTEEQRRTLTIAYWEALDACMKDESQNRLASVREAGVFTLFDFLTCRRTGHQKAADFIAQLDLRGVDPHVSAYAEKALGWHRDGVKLFSRALDLLTDAPTAQFTGPFAQSWQSASTQHQMEERLLAEKHQAVEHYLNHSLTAEPAAPATAATPAP